MLDSNKSTNFNKKKLILKHFSMYRTIRTILRYDTIHMIRTLYRTIYEHLRYADTIQNFLYTIRYISYDMYRVSYDTNNYAWAVFGFYICGYLISAMGVEWVSFDRFGAGIIKLNI